MNRGTQLRGNQETKRDKQKDPGAPKGHIREELRLRSGHNDSCGFKELIVRQIINEEIKRWRIKNRIESQSSSPHCTHRSQRMKRGLEAYL